MIQPRVQINYRPVRIGWIVSDGDLAEFDEAVYLSTCLWGGRHNPIIKTRHIDLARDLVSAFGVDLLIPIKHTPESKEVIEEFPYLISGSIEDRQVFSGDDFRHCLYADIYHPARRLFEDARRLTTEAPAKVVRPVWESNDPLAHVFAGIFGDYPDPSKTGFDYREMLERWFKADTLEIDREDAIDPKCFNWHTPIKLTQIDIWTRQSQYWQRPGIVLGDVSDFDDILLFWNMRAASTPLLFYDITQSQRLRPSIDAFIDLLQENDLDEGRPALNIWSHKDSTEHDLDLGGVPATHYVTSAATTWSDLSVKLPKPRFTKWGIDVVPAYLHNDKTRSVTFSLPQTPFYNDDNHALRQRFVVTVNISQYGEFADQLTFNTPPWPELNEFYGRNFYFDYSAARVEIDELDRSVVGIITDVTSQQQTIYAMRVQSLLKELFRHLRIEIKPS